MTDFVYQERSPELWERRAKQNYQTNHTFRTKVAKGAKPRKKRATTDLAVAPRKNEWHVQMPEPEFDSLANLLSAIYSDAAASFDLLPAAERENHFFHSVQRLSEWIVSVPEDETTGVSSEPVKL